MKGREILGLPVVTQNDGKQIGEIKEIVYDPLKKKIIGYIIQNCRWLRDGKGFLHTDLVRADNESLIIQNDSVVKNINAIPELKEAISSKQDIRGLRVENSAGEYLGVVQDLVVDGHTGVIIGYEISDGVIQDLLDGRTTISNAGMTYASDRVIAGDAVEFDTK